MPALNILNMEQAQIERLHTFLKNIELLPENQEKQIIESVQMADILTRIFGDRISTIIPIHQAGIELGPNEVQAVHCAQLISKLPLNSLCSPIIILWKTNNEHQTRENMRAGPHWQTYVILPKEYLTLVGNKIGNLSPILFFKDALNKKSQPNELLIELLKVGFASESQQRKIGGQFPDLTVQNCNIDDCAHQRHNDSGFWALYNSIMFVLEGKKQFLENKSVTMRVGRALRSLFKYLAPKNDIIQKIKHNQETIHLAQDIKQFFSKKLKTLIKETSDGSLINELNSFTIGQVRKICNLIKYHPTFEKIKREILEIKQNKLLFFDGSIQKAIDILILKNQKLQVYPYLVNQGSFQFRYLVRSDFFVDKSLFIKQIFNENPRLYIVRPKGWGKTHMFEMLRQFFELDYSSNPEDVKLHDAKRILFEGGVIDGKFYKRLKIADTWIMKQCGMYPVVHINFDRKIQQDKCQQFFSQIMVKQFRKHKAYLLDFLKDIDPTDFLTYEKYLSGKSERGQIQQSLTFLTMILHKFWKKQVIVLIDNADSPINQSTKMPQLHEDMCKFQNFFLSLALNQAHIKFAIMFGNFRIDNAFNKINAIQTYGFKQPTLYQQYFGFTEDQMDELFEKVVKNKDWMRQKKRVQEWYNGFEIQGQCLYNPTQIYRFLSYSLKSKGATYQKELFTLEGKEEIIQLLDKNYQQWTKQLKIILQNDQFMFTRSRLIKSSEKNTFQQFATFLFELGHLKRNSKMNDAYKFPNKFVKNSLHSIILPYLLKIYNIDFKGNNDSLDNTVQSFALDLEYKEPFSKSVNSLLIKMPQNENYTENTFHGLIGSLLLAGKVYNLQKTYNVYSEKMTQNKKRLDNIFVPQEGISRRVIIHQYKLIKENDQEKINKLVQIALWQILSKRYLSLPVEMNQAAQTQVWDEVIIRAIVIHPKDGAYKAKIQEFVHSYEMAVQLLDIFSQKQYEQKDLKMFLRQNHCKDLQDFINQKQLLNDRPIRKVNSQKENVQNIYQTDNSQEVIHQKKRMKCISKQQKLYHYRRDIIRQQLEHKFNTGRKIELQRLEKQLQEEARTISKQFGQFEKENYQKFYEVYE